MGIGAAPKSGFANVTRYYNHIQTFNADAQYKFPTIDGLTVSDTPVVAAKAEAKADDSDSDDLGGMLDSDSDDDSDSVDIAAQIAKKNAEKKAATKKNQKKRRPPERSEIILDVKPFDDQTDLEELAKKIKGTTLESLREKEAQKVDERITLASGHKWGENHQLEEMAFGIKKLRLQCVVMNELVGSDLLVDLIQESFPD